jgi:hypothetical protein
MAKIIVDRHDALRHINELYPIGQSDGWDNTWLAEIKDFGIENLPEELLKRMAKIMLENEGEEVIIKN